MDDRDYRNWDDLCPNKEDLNTSPYHNQRTHSEYHRQGFAVASFTCGMVALLLNCIPFVSLIPGAFALLFAALSYRKGRRIHRMASQGIVTASFAIISALILIVQLLTTPIDETALGAYQQQMQEYIQQIQ